MKKIKKTFDSTYGMTHEKFVRREVDEYVRDYMKPIIEDNKSRGIK